MWVGNSFGYTLEFSGPILPIGKILQHYHSIYSTGEVQNKHQSKCGCGLERT